MDTTKSCYGCRHLVQLGCGGNVCIRFDPYEQGGTTLDDDPKPLYEDCYTEIGGTEK